MPENTAAGVLTVVTTTARGTMPVSGAQITVTPSDQSTAPQSALTNGDGRTEPFVLPAPLPEASQTPEQPHPYAVYTVFVEADGFRPVDAIGVAIFAGIRATLPVELIPALGAGQTGTEIEDFPPQTLDQPPQNGQQMNQQAMPPVGSSQEFNRPQLAGQQTDRR